MRRSRRADVLGRIVLAMMLLGASCTKGTGPEIDASTRPSDGRGSGDAGSGSPHDAAPADAAPVDAAPGSDAMSAAMADVPRG